MRKSLILLVICASLTACSDRVRVNCERVKNKALSAVTETTVQIGGGRCG
jgi:hypothetical protein